MKNIEELIAIYKVKITEIVENFHSHYLLKNPEIRNINTAKEYYDEHLENYKSSITYEATLLLHEATFEIKAEDFESLLKVSGQGIQELFLVVMKASI